MKQEYLNNGGGAVSGAVGGAPKGGGMGAGDIAAIIEGVGNIAVGSIDAAKRRKMDFAYNQQKLQAELGLQEKSLAQQFRLQQLNILAQAAGGSGIKDTKKATTIVWVVAGTLALGLAGFVTYMIVKNK